MRKNIYRGILAQPNYCICPPAFNVPGFCGWMLNLIWSYQGAVKLLIFGPPLPFLWVLWWRLTYTRVFLPAAQWVACYPPGLSGLFNDVED